MGRGTHDDSGAGACYGRTDPDLLCEDNSAATVAWLALIPMDKSGMIALGLACVGFGESCNCAVKHIASAQVAADLRGIARAGMSPSKSPSTESTILDEATFAQGFDIHRQLHVSQLAYIVVGGTQSCPPKKEVAGRLHESLPANHSLGVIGIATRAQVTFEHRGLRFLDLQEEGIVAVVAQQ